MSGRLEAFRPYLNGDASDIFENSDKLVATISEGTDAAAATLTGVTDTKNGLGGATNTVYTCVSAGLYTIRLDLVATINATTNHYAEILYNGGAIATMDPAVHATLAVTRMNTSIVKYLSTGDTISVGLSSQGGLASWAGSLTIVVAYPN